MKIRNIETRAAYLNKTVVYIMNDQENIEEDLAERHRRPFQQYKEKLMPTVLKRLGLPEKTKASWRQTAGCPCGCLPGFVLPSGCLGVDVEVFVHVRGKR